MTKPRKKKYRRFRTGYRQEHPTLYVWPRSLARSIAKANMRKAGVEKPNRKMAFGNWRKWVLWKGTGQVSMRKPGRKKEAPYVRRRAEG